MAPTFCLVRRACTCLIPVLESSSSVINLHRFLPFSTRSAKDHAARFESSVEKALPWACDRGEPYLPVPDGFPFSIEELPRAVKFIREDKHETTEIVLCLDSYQLTNGEPSFDRTKISIRRGFWRARLYTLVGSRMLRIWEAEMSEKRDHHLKCFEKILDSKGIDARKLVNLFRKQKKENKGIECLK